MFTNLLQVITVEVRVDGCGQTLPSRDVLLPKVRALRKVLQQAQICKKVCVLSIGKITSIFALFNACAKLQS